MKTIFILFFSLFTINAFSQELASIDFMQMPTGNTMHSITTKSPDLPNKTLVVLVEANGNIFYHYSIKFQDNEPILFYKQQSDNPHIPQELVAEYSTQDPLHSYHPELKEEFYFILEWAELFQQSIAELVQNYQSPK